MLIAGVEPAIFRLRAEHDTITSYQQFTETMITISIFIRIVPEGNVRKKISWTNTSTGTYLSIAKITVS